MNTLKSIQKLKELKIHFVASKDKINKELDKLTFKRNISKNENKAIDELAALKRSNRISLGYLEISIRHLENFNKLMK